MRRRVIYRKQNANSREFLAVAKPVGYDILCREVINMKKSNPKKANMHLEKLRQIIAKNPSPIFKMSKEDVIKTMRKTREKLWEEKFAHHS